MLNILKQFYTTYAELINLVSLVLAAFGVLLSYGLYRASKSKRLLSYATRTFRIISTKASRILELDIRYRGLPVKTLSVTRLGIWNSGNEVLRRADLPPTLPPMIYGRKGVSIFEVNFLESTSLANQFNFRKIESHDSRYVVDFEFLDPNDGVMLSIIHDGMGVDDIVVTGAIMGGRIRKTKTDSETVNSDRTQATRALVISGRENARQSGIGGLCLIILAIIVAPFTFPGAIGAFIAALFLCITYFNSRIVYPPKSLKMFDDNLE